MINKKITAYHEAGHVVMHILTDVALHDVTIVANDDEGFLGAATWNIGPSVALQMNYGSRNREITTLARDCVRISLGGICAEEIAFGRYYEQGAGDDLDSAHYYARVLSRNPDGYVKRQWRETRKMLRQNWRQVQLVADALLEQQTLTGEDVLALLGEGSRP